MRPARPTRCRGGPISPPNWVRSDEFLGFRFRLINPRERRSPGRLFPPNGFWPGCRSGDRRSRWGGGARRLSQVGASDANPNSAPSQIGFVRRGRLEDGFGGKGYPGKPLCRTTPARKLGSFGQNRAIPHSAPARRLGSFGQNRAVCRPTPARRLGCSENRNVLAPRREQQPSSGLCRK